MESYYEFRDYYNGCYSYLGISFLIPKKLDEVSIFYVNPANIELPVLPLNMEDEDAYYYLSATLSF